MMRPVPPTVGGLGGTGGRGPDRSTRGYGSEGPEQHARHEEPQHQALRAEAISRRMAQVARGRDPAAGIAAHLRGHVRDGGRGDETGYRDLRPGPLVGHGSAAVRTVQGSHVDLRSRFDDKEILRLTELQNVVPNLAEDRRTDPGNVV